MTREAIGVWVANLGRIHGFRISDDKEPKAMQALEAIAADHNDGNGRPNRRGRDF